MPSRVLKLDHLCLASSQDKLKVSIQTIATFQLPTTISELEDAAIVKALAFGHLWVTRGIGCRLDTWISADGKLLDSSSCPHILEGVGHWLRDAPLWSHLHLSTVLDFYNLDRHEEKVPHFSIQINNGTLPGDREADPAGWILDHVDIKPPDSVPRAGLEELQLHIDFLAFKEKYSPTIRAFNSTVDSSTLGDVMPLGDPGASVKGHLKALEEVVGGLSRGLCDSVSKCFEASGHNFMPKLQDNRATLPLRQVYCLSKSPGVEELLRNPAPKSAKEKKNILKTWVESHRHNPYPTRDEKIALMKDTTYARASVDRHLSELRRVKKSSVIKLREDELPVSLPDMTIRQWQEERKEEADDMLLDQESDDYLDDDMLLSQLDDFPPSLSSMSSTASTMFAPSQYIPSPLLSLLDAHKVFKLDTISVIRLPQACQLSEISLKLLIGGFQNRPQGIKIKTPPSATSLSLLAPAIFSPGFNRAMANNGRFLQTISRAVCGSWVRNAQGAGLRKKLSLLADCIPLIMEEGMLDEQVSHRRLAAIVQTRLWGMMQRKLYDPAASRRLAQKTKNGTARVMDFGDDDDILAELNSVGGLGSEEMQLGDMGGFIEDDLLGDDNEYEDLLTKENGEDLLNYLEDIEAQRERLDNERETEEMLFGSEPDLDEDEGEEMLLDFLSEADNEGDSMLI